MKVALVLFHFAQKPELDTTESYQTEDFNLKTCIKVRVVQSEHGQPWELVGSTLLEFFQWKTDDYLSNTVEKDSYSG